MGKCYEKYKEDLKVDNKKYQKLFVFQDDDNGYGHYEKCRITGGLQMRVGENGWVACMPVTQEEVNEAKRKIQNNETVEVDKV